MKLTKIVATIGPACDSPELIEKLIRAGVNVFRFNLKHNTLDWHRERIERVNNVAKKIGVNIGTLIDLQGPEIRIRLNEDQLELKEGEKILLSDKFEPQEKTISLSNNEIINRLDNNQNVIADDGYFKFKVIKNKNKVYLQVLKSGILKNKKTMNFPDVDFDTPSLIEQDFEALKMGALTEIDYVALSFVRTKKDVEDLKKAMKEFGLKAKVISKIETKKAIDNLEEIIDYSDGIMVARGDLGVEVSLESVPYYQKKIIDLALKKNKFVITATQMLETMIEKPMPTRAEVSDIANAVFDLTDAVMLSGETANGKYPLEAVEYMSKTILEAEKFLKEKDSYFNFIKCSDNTCFLASAAITLSKNLIKNNFPFLGFVVLTETGKTAEVLSRFRSNFPIFAVTPNKKVLERLSIYYGLYISLLSFKEEGEVDIETIKLIINNHLKKRYSFKTGYLIVLHGDYWRVKGGTSIVRLVKI